MSAWLQPAACPSCFDYIELGWYPDVTMEPTLQDWIKLAAFIDGEGTICIKPLRTKTGRYSQLFVRIVNTDPRLPLWCKEHFGGLLYTSDSNPKRSSKWRRHFTWISHSAQAENIIRNCLPHFILKREQAEVALTYRKTFRVKGGRGSMRILSDADLAIREDCRNELSRLKREIPEEAFIGIPLTAEEKLK